MAIKVTVPTQSTRVVKTTTSTSRIKTSTDLGGLSGVDVTNVQDGYTLIYDETTGKWEAAPATELSANIQLLDGGTF